MATKLRAKVARTKRRETAKQQPVHVALVVRKDSYWLSPVIHSARGEGQYHSERRSGSSWEAFMGTNRDEVIGLALDAVTRWGPDKYQVWTGLLTDHVVPVKVYNVVKGL